MVLSSNPNVFLTYASDKKLKHSTQYKLPVLMPSSQIQNITSLHITCDSLGEIVQLILRNDGKKTWVAQIMDSEVHA